MTHTIEPAGLGGRRGASLDILACSLSGRAIAAGTLVGFDAKGATRR